MILLSDEELVMDSGYSSKELYYSEDELYTVQNGNNN